MPSQSNSQPVTFEQQENSLEDLTGRDRLLSNVLFSWGGHFVFIIAGFILPRMIDNNLGQDLLGVWDFSWSLVSYFSLVQAGIGSSVNRYVAKYRTVGDILGVNKVVSSVSCLLGGAGLLVLLLTILLSLLLPKLFGARLKENVYEAQWVVFFLGASMAVEISLGAFRGILTGCHRWELHNIIMSGWHAVTIVGMIIVLLQGRSLTSIAIIYFVGIVLAYLTRVIFAYRVCKGLRLQLSLVKWKTIKNLFVFSGKTLLPSISKLLLNQTSSIFIILYLGPAFLALYTRPQSLMRHMNTLVHKMAMILVPTTSSLQSVKNLKAIQKLLIKSVSYSFYLVLPMVLVLTVFGESILKVWMGQRYANGIIPAILAVGSLASMSQTPTLMILGGMNAHGRAGIANLIASICSVGLNIVVLKYTNLGLTGVAIAVTFPIMIMNVVYLPLLVCRRVDLDLKQYVLSIVSGPMIHVLPFAICLVVARLIFYASPLKGLLCGCAIGGILLMIFYWQFVLPDRVKMWIFRFKFNAIKKLN